MNNNDEQDYVRLPDPVKTEKLINEDVNHPHINPNINPNINYNQKFDEELNKAIELSTREFNLIQEEQEKNVLELSKKETEQRKNEFHSIKLKLNKILLFDSPNIGKYEIILSIIDIYEQGYINEYKSTTEEFNDIFKLLRTIRLTPQEFESLKKIIVCNEE